MKKINALLILVLSFCLGADKIDGFRELEIKNGTLQFKEERNYDKIDGFRDMKFGDGIEKLGNYTIVLSAVDIVAVKKDEDLKFGDAALTAVKYYFINNKLYNINLFYEKSESAKLMNEIEKKYGLDFIYDKKITSEKSNGYKIERNAFGELKIVEDKEYTIAPISNPTTFGIKNNDAEIFGDCVGFCSIQITNIELKAKYH